MVIKYKTIEKYFLIIGITLSLSILFQVYFIDFDGVHITGGGGAVRFALKLISLLFIFLGLINLMNVKSFLKDIILKIPTILYLVTIVVAVPWMLNDEAYLQSINFLFFAPFYFVDWSIDNNNRVYLFWKTIFYVICIHLLIDILAKITGNAVSLTLIGGMGNANVFGLHIIASSLVSRFILKSYKTSLLLLFISFFTGSLTVSVIAVILYLDYFKLYFFSKIKGKYLQIITIVSIIGLLSFYYSDFLFDENGSFIHAVNKFVALKDYLLVGSVDGSQSVSIRAEYTKYGLELISNNPLSVLIGHPNNIPIYTGDGFIIALLVTMGVPVTILFLLANIYLVYKGFKINSDLSILSSYIIFIFLIFFCTNRILDYWPSGLIYMLSISYLVNTRMAKFSNSVLFNDGSTYKLLHN